MTKSMFSQNWFRVARLSPRVRSHVRIHRQIYRGDIWFVMQDDQTGRYHRLSPAANHMVSLMNGHHTTARIWEKTTEWVGEHGDPPTQDETIRLLSQLHNADLLVGDLPPDIEELAFRADDRARKHFMARVKNPMAVRVPLIDPDWFLSATMGLVRPFFTWFGVLVWLGVVGSGATIAVINWGELTGNLLDRVLIAENILLFVLIYPVIKIIHELGHGYAVKNWGGETREMGVMFLVLIPVPYVDASAASAFANKWQRAVVGGAGILVELFIAGLAMILWVNAEPGLVRAAAFNAALIGGVSTLLFNGNPLLRFDGYYVMSDLVEIPNLGNRSNRHIFYLIKRYLFGMRDETSPATARGERTWFFFYSISAFIYRLFIMVAIALFIASKFFFIGVLLAVWAIGMTLVWPVLKGIRWLIDAPELRRRRRRAVTVSALTVFGVAAATFAVPIPYGTAAQGVIWLPPESMVRAETDGFVQSVVAAPEAGVGSGDLLIRLEDPILAAENALLQAQRAEIATRLRHEIQADRTREAILREQMEHADAAVALNETRLAAHQIAATRNGTFVISEPEKLEGRHVRRGDLLGYVVVDGDAVLRVAVPQGEADLVRRRLEGVEIRFADQPATALASEIIQAVPKAQLDLPSAALTTAAGGPITADPGEPSGTRALEAVFLFDLSVPADTPDLRLGLRANVRFNHGSEPIGYRIARAVRQLFLRQFDV